MINCFFTKLQKAAFDNYGSVNPTYRILPFTRYSPTSTVVYACIQRRSKRKSHRITVNGTSIHSYLSQTLLLDFNVVIKLRTTVLNYSIIIIFILLTNHYSSSSSSNSSNNNNNNGSQPNLCNTQK